MTDVVVVSTGIADVIEAGTQTVEIVTVERQGPPGPPGPQGATGTELMTLVAAGPLSAHRAIAQDATGAAIYATATDSTAQRVIGISTTATGAAGESVTVRQFGDLEWPAGGLTPGVPLFLSSDGYLTHAPPSSGWVRQIAVALATDRIQVGIGPAYQLSE